MAHTLIIAPGIMHRQYGDLDPIAAQIDSAALWLSHMCQYLTNGIISKDGYGDWCVPPEDRRLIHSADPERKTDRGLLATAFFYRDLRLMEGYARLLGRQSESRQYARWAEEIYQAFNRQFFDKQRGYYPEVRFLRMEQGRAVFRVGSGRYRFASRSSGTAEK